MDHSISKASTGKILELTATDMRAFQLQTLYANKAIEQEKAKDIMQVNETQVEQKMKEIELQSGDKLLPLNISESEIKTVDQVLNESMPSEQKPQAASTNTTHHAHNSKTSTIGQIIAQNTMAKQQAQADEQEKQAKAQLHKQQMEQAKVAHSQHQSHTAHKHGNTQHHKTHTSHTSTQIHGFASDLEKQIMGSIEKLSHEIVQMKLKHTITEIVSDLQSLIRKLESMHEEK